MTTNATTASIVILTYNNLNLTRQCLHSILQKTEHPGYEIILVDNASQDGTQAYLQYLAAEHEQISLILNQTNEGFARGNNQGAAAACGEYLVFLNNDTIVTRGWLAGLLKHLQDPRVGMVAPVTNASGNETRIEVDYESIHEMDAFAQRYTLGHQGNSFEIPMLPLLCVAMRRSVFEELGPLDERFGTGMFEDDDYALRMKERGYKILCAEDVFIHHWGSASFARLGMPQYWQLFRDNLEKFEHKWGLKWHPHLQRSELMRQHYRQLVDGMLAFNDQLGERDRQVKVLQEQLSERDQLLSSITQSWSWRLVRGLQRVGETVFPAGSPQERAWRALLKPVRVWRQWGSFSVVYLAAKRLSRIKILQQISKILARLVPGRVKKYFQDFRREYPLVDRSKVTLFADPDVIPAYSPRQALSADSSTSRQDIRVTLISTVRNESAHAHAWLDSIRMQSRAPDEVIITDGGSTDGTAEMIEEYARTYALGIKVIRAPGANISKGRNLAIQAATHPVIACTDFGCTLDPDWLHNLVLPLEVDENIQVSAGYSQVSETDEFARLSSTFFFKDLSLVEPDSFLPSSRSLAFKKTAWEQVDGYPEHLTDAGEDTLFNFKLKLLPSGWAFVPQAKVYWQAPQTLGKFFKTIFRYSKGDGEVGIFAPLYAVKAVEIAWRSFLGLVFIVLLVIAGILIGTSLKPWGLPVYLGFLVLYFLFRLLRRTRYLKSTLQVGFASAVKLLTMRILVSLAQALGFARGVANRPTVEARLLNHHTIQLQEILNNHPHRRGVIIYPPTHDWGFMFQRPHQLARAFANKDYLYFFATNNEKTDAVIGFQQVAPNLYIHHVPLETFKMVEQPIVLIGSPWGRRVLDCFDRPRIIYDHYDEIEVFSADPQDHADLLELADIVLVTAGRLKENVQPHRPDALYIPNGVDYDRIQALRPAPSTPPPPDLQPILTSHKPVIGYSGALAGWFDYDLFRSLFLYRPDLEFVLIGVSYDGSLEQSHILEAGLDNVHWLGMKPYEQLFQYVWHFDVGIIPFKINNLTLSTTPVKLFEYMACHLPVISTALPESKRYPGTFIAEDAHEFLHLLDEALKAGHDPDYIQLIDRVARENTWEQRVDCILESLEGQDVLRTA